MHPTERGNSSGRKRGAAAKTLTTTSGVHSVYAILLSHGEERVKCKDCGEEGTLIFHGSVKTCRSCGGLGRVPTFDQALRTLRVFRLPEDYKVTHGQSVLLTFSGYDVDVVIKSLFAFSVSGIKARIVFPVF